MLCDLIYYEALTTQREYAAWEVTYILISFTSFFDLIIHLLSALPLIISNLHMPNNKKGAKAQKQIDKQNLNSSTQYLHFKTLFETCSPQLPSLLRVEGQMNNFWNYVDFEYFGLLERSSIMNRYYKMTSQRLLREHCLSQELLIGATFEEQHSNICAQSPSLLKVMFKNGHKKCLVQYQCQKQKRTRGKIIEKQEIQIEENPWKVSYQLAQNRQEEKPINFQSTNLAFVQYLCDNEIECKMIDKAHQIYIDRGLTEIQKEEKLWQQQLNRVQLENQISWALIMKSVEEEGHFEKNYGEIQDKLSDEISEIKEYLMWSTIMRYFQIGLADKTQANIDSTLIGMKSLRPPKTHLSNKKAFFETDCKICFSSFNQDSNQVLYCDSCNTSFHLVCYGLKAIPQEEEYFCDCCAHERNEKLHNLLLGIDKPIKKIQCQICCKTRFPLKNIGGHFYHITCLISFNLIHIRNGELALKYTYEELVKAIIVNELNMAPCYYCNSQAQAHFGMRIPCQSCDIAVHPICAYINGCQFHVEKVQRNYSLSHSATNNDRFINVQMQCNNCSEERNSKEQAYIRRFLCDLKGTSSKNRDQFNQQYELELAGLSESKNKIEKCRIAEKSKQVKKFIQGRIQSQKQQKKDSIQTESERLLERIRRHEC